MTLSELLYLEPSLSLCKNNTSNVRYPSIIGQTYSIQNILDITNVYR